MIQVKAAARKALLSKPVDPPKTAWVRMRASPEFNESIRQAAMSCGLSVSEYLRRLHYSAVKAG